MSGRVSLSRAKEAPRAGNLGGAADAAPDDVAAWHRNASRHVGERVVYVPVDSVVPSQFQVRRVFSESEIEALAESIRSNGLIHEPRVRPHPTEPGKYELMPGEMRIRALRRLVEFGEAEGILKKDAEGGWLVPVMVVRVDDAQAEAMVFEENESRTDLSSWEWVLAWQQRRARMQERGLGSGVRDVAALYNKHYQTVGRYLRAADGITPQVLAAAGLLVDGEPDHARMAKLGLKVLVAIAQDADRGTATGADRLLRELAKVGDAAAAAELRGRSGARSRGSTLSSWQVNIRGGLENLSASQAGHYMTRFLDVLPVLAARAQGGLAPDEAERMLAALDEVAEQLRGRSG